jgi:hypothetical protein
MHKPRLVVRFAVALVAFVIGIACTLLVNYLWPGSRMSERSRGRVELRVAPPAPPVVVPHAPCGRLVPAAQPAFAWTPDAPPPPPAPPAAPRPPQAPHAPHTR